MNDLRPHPLCGRALAAFLSAACASTSSEPSATPARIGSSASERSPASAPASAPAEEPGGRGTPELTTPELPGAIALRPEEWEPPPCQIETSTSVEQQGPVYEVSAHIQNVTQERIVVEAADRCPEGPVRFHGLHEGYDYYGACVRGACAGPRGPLMLTLEPGQTVAVARIQVDPRGGPCTRPLDPGTYRFSFGMQTGLFLCGGSFAKIYVTKSVEPSSRPVPRTDPENCPPPLACAIACPGGRYARDDQGCSLCACESRTPRILEVVPSK